MANKLKLFFFLFSCVLSVTGQESNILWPQGTVADSSLFKAVQNIALTKDSSLTAERKNAEMLTLFRQQGYWTAQIAHNQIDSNLYFSIIPGPRIKAAKFKLAYADSAVRPIKEYQPNQTFFTPDELQNLNNYYLGFYENKGFPFAQLQFTDYEVENDSLKGKLLIKPGPYITFDSISIKGFNRFSENVLRYDLGFYKGREYSETYLAELNERIQQVEYLSFTRSPAVAFFEDKTTLFLYVAEQKGNQVDGVIGLNTEPDGETTINGDFQLRLLNTLKSGEEINLRWRRPDESVQQLQLGFILPYLFGTPFWLQADLDIFRQDSSFVNTNFNSLLKYLVADRSFLSGGFTYRSSNVLLNNASDEFTSLNSLQAFESYRYLLGAEVYRTNRVLVPTKGYLVKAYGLTGNRISDGSNQDQYGWRFNSEYYWNFAKNMVGKFGLNTEALFGDKLFENELYRLGGLKTLRGFNEQSIFASAYGVATLEYRYMIGAFDYLTLFADGAYVEKRTGSEYSKNWLTGLGTGINFRTNGGVFSLFLAVGKSDDTDFDFRTTKIHFGYLNQF